MNIMALDLGKYKTVSCTCDTETGELVYRTVKTTPAALESLFAECVVQRVVLEIGPAAGWVGDLAAGGGMAVEVANPNHEGWRWRNVKSKTDRKDAYKLIRLSLMGQLPQVYMPSPGVRQWRSLIAYRQKLIDRRTAIKNGIRSILERQGIAMSSGHAAWTVRGLCYLQGLTGPLLRADLDELWRGELDEELTALLRLERRVIEVEKKLDALGRSSRQVRLLRTIPGVGPRLAEALVATIDNPHRFRCGKDVSSYIGLVPRQYQSGATDYHGRITRQGNALVRRLLVEVSWIALRYNPWIHQLYHRIKGDSDTRKNKAIVAVARRLLVRAWAMLRDQTAWRDPTCPSGRQALEPDPHTRQAQPAA